MSGKLLVFLSSYSVVLWFGVAVSPVLFGYWLLVGALGFIYAGVFGSRQGVSSVTKPCIAGWLLTGLGMLAGLWQLNVHTNQVRHGLTTSEQWVEGIWYGQVVGLPWQDDKHGYFRFRVLEWRSLAEPDLALKVERTLRVRWPAQSDEQWQPGQGWALPLRVSMPATLLDTRLDVARLGLPARLPDLWARPLPDRPALHLAEQSVQLPHLVDQVRFALRQRLLNKIPPEASRQRSSLAILLALTLGDRSLFASEDWQIFQRTGTSHLMAISGFHVGVVFLLVFGLVRLAWVRIALLREKTLASQAAFGCAAVAALGYAGLAGFSIPTQRAVVMLLTVGGFRLLAAQQGWWMPLLMAFVVVVVWDPWSVYSPGFWLSFGAVATIMWVTTGRRFRRRSWFADMLRIQGAVTLGLLPVSVFYFQQVAWQGFVINLIAIPVFAFLLLPLVVVIIVLELVVGCPQALLEIVLWLLWWVRSGLAWAADQPGVWFLPAIDIPMLVAGLVGVALLLLPRKFPGKTMAAVLLLPLFFASLLPSLLRSSDIVVFSARQGLSVALVEEDSLLWLRSHQAHNEGAQRGLQRWLSLRGVDSGARSIADNPNNDPLYLRWFIDHYSWLEIPLSKAGSDSIHSDSGLNNACHAESVYASDHLTIKPIIWSLNDKSHCALLLFVRGTHWLMLDTLSVAEQESLGLWWRSAEQPGLDGLLVPVGHLTGALLNSLAPRQVLQIAGVRTEGVDPDSLASARARDIRVNVLHNELFWLVSATGQQAPMPASKAAQREYRW